MKLTITTINFNNAQGLRKTIESVLNQTSKDFEYLVIDGGSTDTSCQVISDKRLVLNGKVELNGMQVTCICEKDSGIYNAMNKGIRMAKGEYIHFLNSGDWLVDERVVENMLIQLERQEVRGKRQEVRGKRQEVKSKGQEVRGVIDILVGNVLQIRSDGKVRKTSKPNQAVSLLTFYRGTIQHTSAYIRRELFDIYGLYDESLKIVSDWKWYMQVAGLNKANVVFTDIYVSYFDMTGISSTQSELDKAERRKVLEEIIPAPILADYDCYYFDIDQMERIKKHKWLYRMFWFIERVYFKIDKVKRKKFS